MIFLSRYDEALSEIEKDLEKFPGNSVASRNKAEVLFKLNKPILALNFINEALKINSISPESFEIKDWFFTSIKKKDEAIDFFMKAIEKQKKPKQEVLDKMNSIIKNYKERYTHSHLI